MGIFDTLFKQPEQRVAERKAAMKRAISEMRAASKAQDRAIRKRGMKLGGIRDEAVQAYAGGNERQGDRLATQLVNEERIIERLNVAKMGMDRVVSRMETSSNYDSFVLGVRAFDDLYGILGQAASVQDMEVRVNRILEDLSEADEVWSEMLGVEEEVETVGGGLLDPEAERVKAQLKAVAAGVVRGERADLRDEQPIVERNKRLDDLMERALREDRD